MQSVRKVPFTPYINLNKKGGDFEEFVRNNLKHFFPIYFNVRISFEFWSSDFWLNE